ncbi:MAG: formylglycine-generating enzyme family protein [Planctomycetota bacterium]
MASCVAVVLASCSPKQAALNRVAADRVAAPPTTELPADLVAVQGAVYAEIGDLAPGSREAQDRQRSELARTGLALEVRAKRSGLVLRYVPAGSFWMGSSVEDQQHMLRQLSMDYSTVKPNWFASAELGVKSERRHEVSFARGSYVGKFEVSREEWERVMGGLPESSHFQHAPADAPIEGLSWFDSQAFVTKLCALEGVPAGTYRLLTEAEWEYMCRAGTQTAHYGGDLRLRGQSHAVGLGAIAWYSGNAEARYEGGVDSRGWPGRELPIQQAGVQRCGRKTPNAWGLHDTIGNVLEWCADGFESEYPTSGEDPFVEPTNTARVIRGGGWNGYAGFCRAAFRTRFVAESKNNVTGLRIARVSP